MLSETELQEAVEIGNRAYKLLTWLNKAVESGFISLEHAGRYVGDREAAEAWLNKHFDDMPPDARPAERTETSIRRFASYLSTYLTSSFDLHEVPGTRFEPGPGGYCCEMCGYRVPKSHLQPKKLGRRDKEKARALKQSYTEALAKQHDLRVSPEVIDRVVREPEASKDAALASYGEELLRRVTGRASGTAALALWREFAWSPKGSPIKGFKLDADQIKRAEGKLIETLRNQAA